MSWRIDSGVNQVERSTNKVKRHVATKEELPVNFDLCNWIKVFIKRSNFAIINTWLEKADEIYSIWPNIFMFEFFLYYYFFPFLKTAFANCLDLITKRIEQNKVKYNMLALSENKSIM